MVACERMKIGDINADPGRSMNKAVAVAGIVTQSIGVLGRGIYQVSINALDLRAAYNEFEGIDYELSDG